ncbi:hypothetical protein CYMTET_26243 [Cymbomonas tetramitiformis]|uniref:Uncharacterized protein n=1 Tax=Cymbomonas tetramitiformis TaxID=36881 RepID=A0AAE0FSX0_9CHLO|nr:hypothetical protein CYMTET_26243 [Cymbomonas tetramitiformis]
MLRALLFTLVSLQYAPNLSNAQLVNWPGASGPTVPRRSGSITGGSRSGRGATSRHSPYSCSPHEKSELGIPRSATCVATTLKPRKRHATTSPGDKTLDPYYVDLTLFKNTLPPLQTRDWLGKLLQARGYKTGLEVGVQEARFSEILLRSWPSAEKFYLLDAWTYQKNYVDGANVGQREQNKVMEHASRRVARYQDRNKTRVELIRGFSTEKAPTFRDRSLDFIYLDARHDFCAVREDMEAYWPKVACGGILAGHDYMSADEVQKSHSGEDWSLCSDNRRHLGAVRAAVDDFSIRHRVQFLITYREDSYNTWYMQKTC